MVRVHELTVGNTLNCDQDFKQLLLKKLPSWTGGTEGDCDVIVAFCPIVSRVGTDVGAALAKVPGTKPAVLVVFHHTFDREYIVPNTARFVNRPNTITVNCLFHESQGLLRGEVLNIAVEDAVKFLRLHSPEIERYHGDEKLPVPRRDSFRISVFKYFCAFCAFIHKHKKLVGPLACGLIVYSVYQVWWGHFKFHQGP